VLVSTDITSRTMSQDRMFEIILDSVKLIEVESEAVYLNSRTCNVANSGANDFVGPILVPRRGLFLFLHLRPHIFITPPLQYLSLCSYAVMGEEEDRTVSHCTQHVFDLLSQIFN
jgi:hypothetical protein